MPIRISSEHNSWSGYNDVIHFTWQNISKNVSWMSTTLTKKQTNLVCQQKVKLTEFRYAMIS